jgi:hypothetical protein
VSSRGVGGEEGILRNKWLGVRRMRMMVSISD